MQKSALRLVAPTPVNGTVPPRRKPNSDARDREHLTEAEIERLMKAAGAKSASWSPVMLARPSLSVWPGALAPNEPRKGTGTPP